MYMHRLPLLLFQKPCQNRLLQMALLKPEMMVMKTWPQMSRHNSWFSCFLWTRIAFGQSGANVSAFPFLERGRLDREDCFLGKTQQPPTHTHTSHTHGLWASSPISLRFPRSFSSHQRHQIGFQKGKGGERPGFCMLSKGNWLGYFKKSSFRFWVFLNRIFRKDIQTLASASAPGRCGTIILQLLRLGAIHGGGDLFAPFCQETRGSPFWSEK